MGRGRDIDDGRRNGQDGTLLRIVLPKASQLLQLAQGMVDRVGGIKDGWLQAYGQVGGGLIPIEVGFGLGSMLIAVVDVVFPMLRLAHGLQTNRKSVGVATSLLTWGLRPTPRAVRQAELGKSFVERRGMSLPVGWMRGHEVGVTTLRSTGWKTLRVTQGQ